MSSFDSSTWMFHVFCKHCVKFFVAFKSLLVLCTVCKPSQSCKSRWYIHTMYYSMERLTQFFYSLYCKTCEHQRKFWNFYCFMISQMQDETTVWLVMTWHETKNWLSLPQEPLCQLIWIYNLDLHNRNGLQTVQCVNVL